MKLTLQALFVWCCLPVLPALAQAELPAFPEAEGDGAYSVGGRGGKVLVVDRLDDPCPTKACTTEDLADPSKLVPGTLRWALMQPYPRTVVFRVSGVVSLLQDKVAWNARTQEVDISRLGNIRIKSPYLTIAGQTAPAGGITLKNNGLTILTHDVVIRYVRFRTGRQEPFFAGQQTPETLMLENGANKVIIDHCSLSWMPAEGLSVYTGTMWDGSVGTASDITISWNLIGEGLVRHKDGRGHPNAAFMSGFNGDPEYAADRITLHHNLLVHSQKRNGDLLTKRGRLVNNLIYDWQWLPTVLAGKVEADVVGNVWKPGPLTLLGYDLVRGGVHVVPAAMDIAHKDPDGWWSAISGNPSLYLHGNVYGDSAKILATNQDLLCIYRQRDAPCEKDLPPAWQRATTLPVTGRAIRVQPAEQAEEAVLALAGASQRVNGLGRWVSNRDTVDQRYACEYQTGSYARAQLPWHEKEVGGFPVPVQGEPYLDQDRDGMPDRWEQQQGLNPADPVDASQEATGQGGYTWLEVFINGMRAL